MPAHKVVGPLPAVGDELDVGWLRHAVGQPVAECRREDHMGGDVIQVDGVGIKALDAQLEPP